MMKTQHFHSLANAKFTRMVAALASAGILAGCSGVAKDARQTARDEAQGADVAFSMTTKPPVMPMVVDTEDFYVSTKAVHLRDDSELLPAMFRMPLRIQVNPRASIKDVANQITRVSGLSFSFGNDVRDEVSNPTLNSGYTSDSTLKGLLDSLAAQSNMSWRYRDGAVDIYRHDTRVFQIYSPPGTSESTTTISNKNSSEAGGGGGGGGGGSQGTQTTSANGQDYKQSSQVNFWASTEAEIKQMLTPSTGKAVVSQASGTVTVTDTPQVINTIAGYIKDLNHLRSRNVAISVQVYSVESRAGENFDLKLSGIFERMNKYGIKMISPTSGIIEGAASLSAVSKQTDSSFNESSVLLQALNTIGDAAEVDKFSVVTVTGEPAPINSLINESYLAKVTVQQPTFSGGSLATTLEPGVLTYGASGTLTPKLINGTDLQLRVALDLSSRIDLKKISASDGGSSIQLPETASRSFANTFNIKSGETLLIGFQSAQSRFKSSSVGDPNVTLSLLTGGSREGSKSTRTLIYAITPHVTAVR